MPYPAKKSKINPNNSQKTSDQAPIDLKSSLEPAGPSFKVAKPILVSVAEAAKLIGAADKTIRRAIDKGELNYIIKKNRYFIDLGSVLDYAHSSPKLLNKLNEEGLGQYIAKWRRTNSR